MPTEEEGREMHDAGEVNAEATALHGSEVPTLRVLAERLAQLEFQVAALQRELPPVSTAEPALSRARLTPSEVLGREDAAGAATMRERDVSATPALPPPLPGPMSTPMPGMTPRASLEDRLGSQIFNLIGIIALIVGTSWGLKLAFEHGWVGPAGRVLIGLAAGVGLTVWSERFRRKGLPAFSYSLKAVGCGVLYLSLWAAFQLYHLLPSAVALAAMLLVTAWIAFMAWTQDAELLAAYALAGGFATPLLLASGGDHETFLFTYVAAIDAAAILLIRLKPWPRLLLPALLATIAYFVGWYESFFARELHFGFEAQAWETTAFALLFFSLFALVSVRGWVRYTEAQTTTRDVIVPVLLPLMNAAFVGRALYVVFQDRGLHAATPWLMLGLSAVFLGLMRVQRTALASAVHLAAAIVFLTVAIPLKAHGHSLTVAWLVEGLVLFWVATRFDSGLSHPAGSEATSRTPTRVLQWLALAGYGLGLGSLLVHWFGSWSAYQRSFFNPNLFAALVALTVLALAAGLVLTRDTPTAPLPPVHVLLASLLSIDLVALLLASGELVSYFERGSSPSAFRHVSFPTALIGLGALAGAAWAAYRIARRSDLLAGPFARLAGGTLVLFNLGALLTFVYEIGGLWTSDGTDARLQRRLRSPAF